MLESEIYDFNLIKTIFYEHQETTGFRTIIMELKDKHEIKMNHKKVIRLMNKYGLVCKIRRKKTYGSSFDKSRIEHTYPYLIKTNFNCKIPRTVLHTDITYIKYAYGRKTADLSVIKDQATREILSYKISDSLEFCLFFLIL